MAKITLTTPFFVFVLSVLTVLLLWQDVSAQRPEREQRSISRTTDTAEPVEAPAEAVAEAEPAQEPGKGTMTVDGETRSIVFSSCRMSAGGGKYSMIGRAKDDAGSTLRLRLSQSNYQINVTRNEPERINISYMNRGNDAEDVVFRVDGSTVTVDGPFQIRSRPDLAANTSIQMSFDCSG